MNHRYIQFGLLAVVAGGAVCACATWQPGDGRRTVDVAVTVQAPAGTPIANLGVSLATGVGAAVGRTDSNGSIALHGTVESGATSFSIALTPILEAGYYAERTQDMQRYTEVVAAHSFEILYPVTLIEGVSSYTLSIVGQPACTVTARVLVGGQRAKCSVIHKHTMQPTDFESGSVSVGGVPAGQPGLLFVDLPADERVFVLEVPATPAGETAALGDVSVEARAAAPKVRVHVDRRSELEGTDSDPTPRDGQLTLISAANASAFCVAVHEGGDTLVADRVDDSEMQLPAGAYFVCPGALDGVGLPTKLWSLVHAGRASDVEAAGVPKILVVAGGSQLQSFTVDGVAAEAAVRGVQ